MLGPATVEFLGGPLDGLRVEATAADISIRKPLKSVFTLKPCLCGRTIGYLTIGHVPIAFEEDDPALEGMATMGEVVDAPQDAELFSVLRGRPKCWGKT